MEFYIDIALRLLIASILGGVIGLERAGSNHDAGIRTHLMVCLGAAGVMTVGDIMSTNFSTDPARIGAQVVSGIGFLGAGCILVNGNRIKGLTTAAGLWTTACVGLASGLGYYFIAGIMTAVMLIAMFALRPIANRLKKKGQKKDYKITIKLKNNGDFKSVTDHINEHECRVSGVDMLADNTYLVKIQNETEENISVLILELMANEDVRSVERK
ncbi:MAG: MgtC/SapB family protein [Clostridia bacterium]|nr:MgtC/SapB family protein [Clostridia bacterium]